MPLVHWSLIRQCPVTHTKEKKEKISVVESNEVPNQSSFFFFYIFFFANENCRE